MGYLKTLWQREPARCVAVLMACVAAAATFGVHLSDPQMEAVKNVLSLVVPLLAGGEVTRSQVAPS